MSKRKNTKNNLIKKMELRSSTATSHNHLVNLLKGFGVYEDGMELEEMRACAQALQDSALEEESLILDRVIQADLLSSTMITAPAAMPSTSMRDCDSPPSDPIRMTVQALVHHPLDWSPTSEIGSSRKRRASESSSNEVPAKRNILNEQEPELEPAANPDVTPISLNTDSGCEEIGSLSSISNTSSMPSIGEIPSRLLISTSSAVVSDLSHSSPEHSHQD